MLARTMPKITASAPVLLVSDVVASANYFRDAIGFAYEGIYGQPPGFCICNRDRHYLMLAKAEPSKIVPFWKIVDQMWGAYFWVDNADALYAEIKARGGRMDYGPSTKPYGVREFGIQDLDGNDIGFGQVLENADGAPNPPAHT
jgi:predicted enzyme related to lactoylglutathione lyase